MTDFALTFCWVAIGCWIASWIGSTFSMVSAARQAKVIKKEYFRAILRQEIAYFDTVDPAAVAQQLTEETKKVKKLKKNHKRKLMNFRFKMQLAKN